MHSVIPYELSTMYGMGFGVFDQLSMQDMYSRIDIGEDS